MRTHIKPGTFYSFSSWYSLCWSWCASLLQLISSKSCLLLAGLGAPWGMEERSVPFHRNDLLEHFPQPWLQSEPEVSVGNEILCKARAPVTGCSNLLHFSQDRPFSSVPGMWCPCLLLCDYAVHISLRCLCFLQYFPGKFLSNSSLGMHFCLGLASFTYSKSWHFPIQPSGPPVPNCLTNYLT